MKFKSIQLYALGLLMTGSVHAQDSGNAPKDVFGDYLKKKSEWIKNEDAEVYKSILNFVSSNGGETKYLSQQIEHIEYVHVRPNVEAGHPRPIHASVFRYDGDLVAQALLESKTVLEQMRFQDVTSLRNALEVAKTTRWYSSGFLRPEILTILTRGADLMDAAAGKTKREIAIALLEEISDRRAAFNKLIIGSGNRSVSETESLALRELSEIESRVNRVLVRTQPKSELKSDVQPKAVQKNPQDCSTDDVLRSLRDLAKLFPDLKKAVGDVATCDSARLDAATTESTKKLLEEIQVRLNEAKKAVGAEAAK